MSIGNEVLVNIDTERSSGVQEEKFIQNVMMSNTIQSDTLSLWRLNPKALLIMEKADNNLWLGNLVHSKCKKIS